VRQFAVALGPNLSAPHAPQPRAVLAQQKAVTVEAKPIQVVTHEAPVEKVPTAAPDPHQKQFFESLVSRMESLQNQNRDLLDQLAETNRDMMKLQFRVDTHSESFRPLPVSEDRPFTSLENESGVLPPRAEPVQLPLQE
jgi:citrate synthase